MPRIPQKNAKGLQAQFNSLTVPDGSVERLVNVIHQQENLYVKERGFETIYTNINEMYAVFEYDDYVFAVFNDSVVCLDKDGGLIDGPTTSTLPFELDGTLYAPSNSFNEYVSTQLVNDFLYFTTPDGPRVLRAENLSDSYMVGIDAPILTGTQFLTNVPDSFNNDAWSYAAGTVTMTVVGHGITVGTTIKIAIDNVTGLVPGPTSSEYSLTGEYTATAATANTLTYTPDGAPTNTSGTMVWYYSTLPMGGNSAYGINDFILYPADKTSTASGQYQVGDVPADSAVSFRAVMRREFDNGKIIESAPSSPIFAFNPLVTRTWTNVGTTITITHTKHGYTVGRKYSGKVANGVDGSGNAEDNLNGIGLIFTIATANTYTYTVTTAPTAASGFLDTQFDRYSLFTAYCPYETFNTDYLDIYYSQTEIDLSTNPLAIPSGNYYLAKEQLATSYNINVSMANGIFQKGLPLYTNNDSTTDSTAQPNAVAPGAFALETWKGCLFYANTWQRETVQLTHIGGERTAPTFVSLQFTDSGTPENYSFSFVKRIADGVIIKKRVQSLASNIIVGQKFVVQFSPDTDGYPGGITITSLTPGRRFKVFSTDSATAASFEPALGTSFNATTVISDNERRRNRIYWSKQSQPEAVPFFVDVGSENFEILGIKRVRESLIVSKRDGFFALFGDPANGLVYVREIDSTIRGISATGITSLGNRMFAKTDQGIAALSETSINLVSRNQIEPLVKVSDEQSVGDTVMYAQDEDRQLYVCTAKSPVDSTKVTYSYNYVTQTWSELSQTFRSGIIIQKNNTVTIPLNNNRYIVSDDGLSILRERKRNLLSDWSNESVDVTVLAVVGVTVTVTSGTGIPASSLLFNGRYYRVLSHDDTTGVIELATPFPGVATDTVTLYQGIQSIIKLAPLDGGDSSIEKQFTTFVMNLRYDAFSACTLKFSNDWSKTSVPIEWEKENERRGWGQGPWGYHPWGDGTTQTLQYFTLPSQIVQTEIPRQLQKSTFIQAEITHDVACEGMFIQQMSYQVNTDNDRAAR